MGFVNKWPSKMQGQWLFRSRAGRQQFSVGSNKYRFFGRAAAPIRIYLPKKVRGVGGFNVLRLRARDHYTSSTLIGGKGGAGPSSLHAKLEGPT
jgi:hypothetical protein